MGKPLPDVIAPGLAVLFCGINPSLVSAERGHHFARPGNRFWPALHRAGLTPRRLAPEEDRELLRYGLGVTNLVDRPTRAAAELTGEELRAGAATWVVPNPSGLNAHHQLPDLARRYAELVADGGQPSATTQGAEPSATVSASTVAGSSNRSP